MHAFSSDEQSVKASLFTFASKYAILRSQESNKGGTMYTRARRTPNTSFTANQRNRRLLVTILILILVAAVAFLSILYMSGASYRNNAQVQFKRHALSAVVDAIDNVNRLTSGVQSDSASKLALVRQNVYLMDKINNISMTLSGQGGTLIPAEALSVLYEDLTTYERLLQTATSSTLEIRTTLLTHLTALHEIIRQQ